MAEDDCVIGIDDWPYDETYGGVYPKGAREKDVYFSPKPAPFSWIKPAHRYMHKKSIARYPWQFWIEIAAYRLGQIVGVTVPPTFVGLRHAPATGAAVFGALIEWFYTLPHQGYVEGGSFMTRAIKDFDVKEGTQHNLETILNLGQFSQLREEWVNYWAEVLAFDTLIGNRDRHQDNWGFISRRDSFKLVKIGEEVSPFLEIRGKFSPAFDNGTAWGHEILEANLGRYDDEATLERYITNRKARHHMKWSLEESEPINYFEFMRRFVVQFPATRARILAILDFSLEKVECRLRPLLSLVDDPHVRLSEPRLSFMMRLLSARRELLRKTIAQ